MADIQLTQTHHLTAEQARAKVDVMAAKLAADLGLTTKWVDANQLRFERSGASGVVMLQAQQIAVEVSLGFLLKAMKGTIEREIASALADTFGADN
ncbi:MAG: polyhydroxyalkanoic acid system family protein [Gammaproteobacteria bacterium]|nr:polyhydroxyalkanoic acid system family protein [Gammaproteobacteria bacterium]NVK87825.1 polyhydroxyalkanoic acid system family protein [Gammaproteobacteria bacterium]